MANTLQLPGRRALRVATGTALCLAVSFALDLPIPVVGPVFAVFLLATQNRPLSFKAGIAFALVVALTTGSGLKVTTSSNSAAPSASCTLRRLRSSAALTCAWPRSSSACRSRAATDSR